MAYDVSIDKINQEEWERYAADFEDYSIYQTWGYQQVRSEVDDQQVSRAVVNDENGDTVAMCQVRIKNVKVLSLKIGYVQWGPLFRRKDGKITCTAEAVKKLRQAYVGPRVNILRLVPNIRYDEKGQQLSRMLLSGGFEHVHRAAPYRTFILQVDDCEEGIRKRLRKSFRRDLKYAENSDIEIRVDKDQELFETLEELYTVLLQRKKFKGLNPWEFSKAQKILATPEKMNIVLASKEGQPVAAHLASNLGDTAVVLLAASNPKGLSCGSSYLIWYQAAVAACRAGMRWYDLGGIDPKDNPTVYQFKSRMGGKETCHIGTFEACSSLCSNIIWHTAERAYKLIKR